MNNTNRRTIHTTEGQLNSLSMLFLSILLVYYLMPAVQLAVKFYILLGTALVFTCASFVLTNEQYGLKILIANVLLIVLFFILGDIDTFREFIGKFHNYFSVCFPAILLSWFLPRSTRKQKWIIMVLIVVMYVIVLGNTYQVAIQDDTAIRQNDMDMELRAGNVGTYDFVYATGALVPFLAICFLEVKKRWQKILFAGMLFVILYLMLVFQYTIALLGALIALVAISLLKGKSRNCWIVYIICILIVLLGLQSILTFIAQLMPATSMSDRLFEIIDFLSGKGEMGYNLKGRLSLYWQAVQAFLKHPLTGNSELLFDTHSTILNVFARVGICGGAIYIWMLSKMKRYTEYFLQVNREKWKFTPIFIYLIFVAMTNPIHAAFITNAMVWFVVPLGLSLLEKEEEHEIMGN